MTCTRAHPRLPHSHQSSLSPVQSRQNLRVKNLHQQLQLQLQCSQRQLLLPPVPMKVVFFLHSSHLHCRSGLECRAGKVMLRYGSCAGGKFVSINGLPDVPCTPAAVQRIIQKMQKKDTHGYFRDPVTDQLVRHIVHLQS